MPQVELLPEHDETLERLAPSYITGKNNASSRVAWAVIELAKRMDPHAKMHREGEAKRLYDERVGSPDGLNTACREEDARFGATIGDKAQRARRAGQAPAEENQG